MSDKWIIEARVDGRIVHESPQPEDVFGPAAFRGITEDQIAKVVFRLRPEAVLDGREIHLWPSNIDKRFVARRKTW